MEIDAVAIATPIVTHKMMTMETLRSGFHVLLEKPPAVRIEDFDEMLDAKRRSGKHCAVQFQNTSGKAFRLLLQKLQEGVIGNLQTVTATGLWKRTDDYYERTPWAGKLYHNGQSVLDGTIMNPLAHLLHNALVAAGCGDPVKAAPQTVQAELYKGHDIESEDTSCVRIEKANNTQILFYATLCYTSNSTPYMVLQGDYGSMKWDYTNHLTVTDKSGNDQEFSFEQENLFKKMYLDLLNVLNGKRIRYTLHWRTVGAICWLRTGHLNRLLVPIK